MSDGTSTEFGPGRLGHRTSQVAVVVSDDHGRSWRAGDFVVHNETRFRHPNETCLVELADRRVLANIRAESTTHRRLISVSADGARDWTEPHFDNQLLEPICFAGLCRFEDAGGHDLAFSNPGVLERTMPGGPGSRGIGPEERGRPFDRKYLTLRVSRDDGASWPVSRVLEAGPAGYSDLTALSDGSQAEWSRSRDATTTRTLRSSNRSVRNEHRARTCDRDPPHPSRLTFGSVVHRIMLRRTVVPHHHIARSPAVHIAKLGTVSMGRQKVKQPFTLALCHVGESPRELVIHKERTASGLRMCAHNRMSRILLRPRM